MKKYSFCFAVWMAVVAAIYAVIYLLSPLGSYGLMWMTFVALPIYFTSGANPKEAPNYICSMLAGLVWGLINIWFTNFLLDAGLSAVAANAINLLLMTIVSVGIHLAFLSKTWFNKVPMMFGGLAMTFSQGGSNISVIAITMTCGILIAVSYYYGGKWLEKKFLEA